MFSFVIPIVLSLTLLLGGGSAAVVTAQGSLPGQTLYPVKIFSEQARLSLANSTQEQLQLSMEFVNRRIDEVTRLKLIGQPIPVDLSARIREELGTELRVAAGMDDSHMAAALEQIRFQAKTQEQKMDELANSKQQDVDPELARIRERLQEQERLASAGQVDPQGFRAVVRERQQKRQGVPEDTPGASRSPVSTGTGYGPGSGAGPQQTVTSGQSGTRQLSPSHTPQPTGGSYGPGPGAGGRQQTATLAQSGTRQSSPSQTPQPNGGSYGPGPGAGSGKTTSTPGGYGDGLKVGTSTCTPLKDGSGPGPGPQSSQTPQSGGSGPIGSNATTTANANLGGGKQSGQP